jgi:hypothetical protein
VFPGGPIPLGLHELRRHVEAAGLARGWSGGSGCGSEWHGGRGSGGGSGGAEALGAPGWVYGGPTGEPRPGDYVACLVREVAGNATLMAEPLAKTSLREFVALLGATAPGRLAPGHPAAGWVGAAAAAAGAWRGGAAGWRGAAAAEGEAVFAS